MGMLKNLLLSKDQSYDYDISLYIREKTKRLLRPSTITDNELIFETSVNQFCYIGIRKIIIEWQTYQDEQFCEVSFVKCERGNVQPTVQGGHYMSFTKPAGLRLTDIEVVSRSEVVSCYRNSTFTLKLST